MEDDVKKSFAGLLEISAKQYEINANLWASIHAMVAAMKEADPTFESRLEVQTKKAKSEFVEANSAVLQLVRRVIEEINGRKSYPSHHGVTCCILNLPPLET